MQELSYGYTGRVLRVDLTASRTLDEKITPRLLENFLGGRGLATKILFDETKAHIDPLGSSNKIVLATGPLTATITPTTGRLAVAFKSPLTGFIGHCSVGGFFGSSLKMAGLDAIIVDGLSQDPCYLFIENDSCEIRSAEDLWGLNCYMSLKRLKQKHASKDFHFAVIGEAGERKVPFACTSFDGSRQAGRGGCGAVMGSKGLKAIAVRGDGKVPVAKPEALQPLCRNMIRRIVESLVDLRKYGTSNAISAVNEMRALPVRNYQVDYFDRIEQLTPHQIEERIKDGEMKLVSKSCWMCPVGCEKSIRILRGKHAGQELSIEFESLAMLGPNLDISDLQSVLHFMALCDDFGIDTISTGGVVAFAMECFEKGAISRQQADGLELKWGNESSVEELIRKISLREGIGRVLSCGSLKASRELGEGTTEYAMQVKGMELPAWSPRVFKGMGLMYAIGDRGGDHLQGPMMRIEQKPWVLPGIGSVVVDKSASESKGDVATMVQDVKTVLDCLIVCLLPSKLDLEEYSLMLSATLGEEILPTDLLKIGERVINLSRLYNIREGLSRKDDVLPKRFHADTICEGESESERFDAMVDQYFGARGWDKGGRPTIRKMVDLDLVEEYSKGSCTS